VISDGREKSNEKEFDDEEDEFDDEEDEESEIEQLIHQSDPNYDTISQTDMELAADMI
jgi:hypothetical protein